MVVPLNACLQTFCNTNSFPLFGGGSRVAVLPGSSPPGVRPLWGVPFPPLRVLPVTRLEGPVFKEALRIAAVVRPSLRLIDFVATCFRLNLAVPGTSFPLGFALRASGTVFRQGGRALVAWGVYPVTGNRGEYG